MRDSLALHGGQRIVSLGYATSGHPGMPQDGIEPIRRMVKWIVDEGSDPAEVSPPWLQGLEQSGGEAAPVAVASG